MKKKKSKNKAIMNSENKKLYEKKGSISENSAKENKVIINSRTESCIRKDVIGYYLFLL